MVSDTSGAEQGTMPDTDVTTLTGAATDPAVALLFRPMPFGPATLRNRIAMAPMTRNRSPGGVPGEDVAAYYRRRADGGVGLVITEGTYVDHPAASGYEKVPMLAGEAALAGWRHVVDSVHAAGALIIPQLWHVGAVRRLGMSPDPTIAGIGPMDVTEDGKRVVRAMTEADVEAVAESYARAAAAAIQVGFDGIELHGAHGYLIDQFLWHRSNRRTDSFGGPIENRVRLAGRIVAAVRGAIGTRMPLVFRFSQWKMSDYEARLAETPDELARFLGPLAAAGVDHFHVSTRRFWEPAFAGSDLSLAGWTRKLSGKPVIAVGSVGLDKPHQTRRLRTPENVRAAVTDLRLVTERMAADEFDLVAVGRALLADFAWPAKVRRGDYPSIAPLTPEALETFY
jgi:2,4-dienoyl-CoA reductase-like NADH-dependent reductase (Old Yellow Enzyme family)